MESPLGSCQSLDGLDPLCSLCFGAGFDVVMNVILGDYFEEVALHIPFHSCTESKQYVSGEYMENWFAAGVNFH